MTESAGEDLAHIRMRDGVRLVLARHGPEDGPPVLLLHGFPEDRSAWRRQIDPLAAEGLRVLVPDLRGYRDSDAPEPVAAYAMPRLVEDVLHIVREAAGGRAVVVGHDWGGVIAFAAAAAAPELVSRLVVLNAPHLDAMAGVIRKRPTQLLRHPPARLGRIRVPTTILWGMKDVALDTALATASRDLCRDARLALFPRASHWLQHEEPEAVAVAIVEAARAG